MESIFSGGGWGIGHDFLRALVGQRVKRIEIDIAEQHYLRLTTDEGMGVLEAVGDCCSESWFYHVLGVDALLGGPITAIQSDNWGEGWGDNAPEDGKTRQEYDKLYKITITTTRGYCDIEFRNSSNGYYGGWLEARDDVPQGVPMKDLTEDYTA